VHCNFNIDLLQVIRITTNRLRLNLLQIPFSLLSPLNELLLWKLKSWLTTYPHVCFVNWLINCCIQRDIFRPRTSLTQPHLCACSKPGPEFQTSHVVVFLCSVISKSPYCSNDYQKSLCRSLYHPFLLNVNILLMMKRKSKQRWPPISTKRTITYHLNWTNRTQWFGN
jgi:hypothetical protein